MCIKIKVNICSLDFNPTFHTVITIFIPLLFYDGKKRISKYSDLLEHVSEPNRSIANKLWKSLKTEVPTAAWSSHNHQAREGGYFGHILDICNFAKIHYEAMSQVRELPFTLWDAILVLFLHDMEKPFTYAPHEHEEYKHLTDYELRDKVIKDRWFELTEDHRNGLIYVHGEWDDHKKNERVQWPLAAFVHCMDTMSARIFYDMPKTEAW